MANEVSGNDLHHATTRNTRATVAAALVTTSAFDPSTVNMHDAESMRAYAARLHEAINLVMTGISGSTT